MRAPDPHTQAIVRQQGLGFVEQQEGAWLLFHGGAESFLSLDSYGIPWRRTSAHMSGSATGYPSPEEMEDELTQLAATYPGLATLVALGESRQGRPILGLKISATSEPAMQWRILAAHHGDELSSASLALSTAQHLLSAYGQDEAATQLLDRDRVWVVPHVNPDGVADQSRYNSQGVDLNRNYEYQWSETEWASGASPFSEVETQVIRTMGDWAGYGAGLSMHSGAANIGWVWNYTTVPAPDGELLVELAEIYDEQCSLGGFWITNGAAWYITYGDTNDWSYGRHGTLDFTLEVSEEKSPPISELADILSAHIDAVSAFMTEPPIIAGTVASAESGYAIPATVTFATGEAPLRTGPEGRFGRPVSHGTQLLQIHAPGYRQEEMSTESGTVGLQVLLEPLSILTARPSPALLSRTGDGTFSLDVEASAVTLHRPGHPDSPAWRDDSRWSVDLDHLAPGPWSLDIDGQTSPRSLFIGERDHGVEIFSSNWSKGRLEFEGAGFSVGSRAWALFGEGRPFVPLPLLYEDSALLQFDSSSLPSEGVVDILVLSNGYQLAALDLASGGFVDTGEPWNPDTGGTNFDSGSPGIGNTNEPGAEIFSACACSNTPIDFPRALLVVSLSLLMVRGRRTQ